MRAQVVQDWCDWEDAVVSLDEGRKHQPLSTQDAAYRTAFARLCAHYFSRNA